MKSNQEVVIERKPYQKPTIISVSASKGTTNGTGKTFDGGTGFKS